MYQRLQQCLALVNRKRFCLNNNAHPYVAQPYSAETVRTWLRNLPHPALIGPLINRLPLLLDHFLQGKIFNNQAAAKITFREFIDSRTPEFYANEIKKLSHWQKYVDSNDSYFD